MARASAAPVTFMPAPAHRQPQRLDNAMSDGLAESPVRFPSARVY